MDGPGLRKRFGADGFVIVPDLLGRKEAAKLKEEIARVLDTVRDETRSRGDDSDAATRGGVFVGLSARSTICRDLMRDERILDVLEAVYAPNIEFLSDKVVFKSRAMDFGTPWHQDWPYWHGAHKISVWLALDNATPENGCMMLLPGSHVAPLNHEGGNPDDIAFQQRLRPGEVDESLAVTAAVGAGGAVFFHDLALHSSYPNRTGADRWAWIGTYRDATADDQQYSWAVAREVVRGMRGGSRAELC